MRTTLLATLLLSTTAYAQPGADDDAPPSTPSRSTVIPRELHEQSHTGISTTNRWGGGIRLTGLSGIGALPGVNFGGEVAGHLRRDELFGELALGRWKPEDTYHVPSMQQTELALDVWTVRAGFASMRTPIRIWGLVEAGEVAGATQMPGVVTRMVMGETPRERRWTAVGAGMGIAWPVSDQARLVGNLEFAVPLSHDELMLDEGVYKPDPMAARYSIGLEVGWR
jgi:hypothetical protein